jgi:hypothetical protein
MAKTSLKLLFAGVCYLGWRKLKFATEFQPLTVPARLTTSRTNDFGE